MRFYDKQEWEGLLITEKGKEIWDKTDVLSKYVQVSEVLREDNMIHKMRLGFRLDENILKLNLVQMSRALVSLDFNKYCEIVRSHDELKKFALKYSESGIESCSTTEYRLL